MAPKILESNLWASDFPLGKTGTVSKSSVQFLALRVLCVGTCHDRAVWGLHRLTRSVWERGTTWTEEMVNA